MKIPHPKFIQLIVPFFVFTLLLSCSKDTDLLSEYVNVNSNIPEELVVRNLAISDNYVASSNEKVVMDVLLNDTFTNLDSVKIIKTSDPTYGAVLINEDKTITYTPTENTSEENSGTTTDSFSYTTEMTNSGETTTQEATVSVALDLGPLKAFPGAEGFGKNATGGRGGIVYHVKNLNDSGSGSLRNGVENISGPRTIVFDVSGYITLKSTIKVREGYGNLTIAGQTAPGDGITVKGASFWIYDSNVIIRHIRIRPGYSWNKSNGKDPSDPDYENDDVIRILAWSNSTVKDIVLDHCSFSWGRDELMEIGANGSNNKVLDVTVQNCVISENIDKGYGVLVFKRATNISFYGNLLAHTKERNISSGSVGNTFEFVNNVVYGFKRGTKLSYENKANIIGNVYISNPSFLRENQTVRLAGASGGNISLTKAFVNDNIEDGQDITISNSGANNLTPYLANSPVLDSGLRPSPNTDVKNSVFEAVGASLFRDEVDRRIVSDAKNRSGQMIKNENEVGGYPNLKSVSRGASYDTDKDGMSDNWEIANNLDPNNPGDGKVDSDGDGYTNLEAFLFGITQ